MGMAFRSAIGARGEDPEWTSGYGDSKDSVRLRISETCSGRRLCDASGRAVRRPSLASRPASPRSLVAWKEHRLRCRHVSLQRTFTMDERIGSYIRAQYDHRGQ